MAWNFLLYYFNHSAQQIWSDGIHRKRRGKGKKKGRNERIHAPVNRGKRFSLSLSLPSPLSFFHYSRNVHLFAWTRRAFVPTIVRPDNGPQDWSFDSVPVVDSFFFLLSFPRPWRAPPLTGKSFHSWNFLIVPASPLFHEARPRGWPWLSFRTTWNRAIQRGETYFSPLPVSRPIVRPRLRRVSRSTSRRERPFFLLLRGVNLPRN